MLIESANLRRGFVFCGEQKKRKECKKTTAADCFATISDRKKQWATPRSNLSIRQLYRRNLSICSHDSSSTNTIFVAPNHHIYHHTAHRWEQKISARTTFAARTAKAQAPENRDVTASGNLVYLLRSLLPQRQGRDRCARVHAGSSGRPEQKGESQGLGLILGVVHLTHFRLVRFLCHSCVYLGRDLPTCDGRGIVAARAMRRRSYVGQGGGDVGHERREVLIDW